MLSVLYVDDETYFLELCKLFLEASGSILLDTVNSAKQAIQRLSSNSYDAIISDYQMPNTDGIEFLKMVRSSGNNIPFILFTGKGREEVVIEAFNHGADLYVQKGGDPVAQFKELEHKLRLVISQRKIKSELNDYQRKLTDIIDFLPDATFAVDREGVVITWNRAIEELTGIHKEEMLGTGNFSYSVPFYGERHPILIDQVFEEDPGVLKNYQHVRKDGSKITAEIFIKDFNGRRNVYLWGIVSPLYNTKENIVGAIESIRDITTVKKSINALYESERKYRNVVEDQTEFISRFLPDGTHVFVNKAYCRYFNRSRDEIIGKRFIPEIHEDDRFWIKKHFESLTQRTPVGLIQHRIIMPSGEIRWQRWSDRGHF